MFSNYIGSVLDNSMLRAHHQSSSGVLEDIQQDGIALATNRIMQDVSLQGNTKSRYGLQQLLGPKPKASKDGKTIAQLRAEKKSAPQQAPPPPVPASEVDALLASKSERFSRNKLSKSKLHPRALFETPSTASQQSTFPSYGQYCHQQQWNQPSAGYPAHNPSVARKVKREVVDLQDSEEEPEVSPVEDRKKKLRRELLPDIQKSPRVKTLYTRLIKPTPTKSIDTAIGDTIALEYDTPTTRKHLHALFS